MFVVQFLCACVCVRACARREGQFKWADGSAPVYTNWAPGEPNDSKTVGGEDCTVINWKGDKWNDVKCTSNKWSEGFVCSAEVIPKS